MTERPGLTQKIKTSAIKAGKQLIKEKAGEGARESEGLQMTQHVMNILLKWLKVDAVR